MLDYTTHITTMQTMTNMDMMVRMQMCMCRSNDLVCQNPGVYTPNLSDVD